MIFWDRDWCIHVNDNKKTLIRVGEDNPIKRDNRRTCGHTIDHRIWTHPLNAMDNQCALAGMSIRS